MDEKLEILQMIRDNRLTPEEGVRLLEAIEKADSPEPAAESNRPVSKSAKAEAKWLNIEIRTRLGTSFKSLTPIRIPFSMLRVFFRFISNASFPKHDFDPEEVLRTLESGEPLEFLAEDGGRAIRISAE